MYCPNCGQQQVSTNLRFCSRCGFPLGLVSEVLAHGGSLPQLASLQQKKTFLTRRNVFIFGLVWFLVFTFLLIPITAVLFGDFRVGEQLVPFIAIIGTMGGLLLMLFSLFFQSAAKNNFEGMAQRQNFASPGQFNVNPQQNALPPQSANFNPVGNAAYIPPAQQPVPQSRDWRESNTNELTYPPSVTEDTTKLLQKKE